MGTQPKFVGGQIRWFLLVISEFDRISTDSDWISSNLYRILKIWTDPTPPNFSEFCVIQLVF
jgi:hypothetical protein